MAALDLAPQPVSHHTRCRRIQPVAHHDSFDDVGNDHCEGAAADANRNHAIAVAAALDGAVELIRSRRALEAGHLEAQLACSGGQGARCQREAA